VRAPCVLAAIPITPGGLGVVEGVLVPSLVGFGATRGAAIVAVIGYRLVNFWLPIPAGAGACLSLRVSGGRQAASRRDDLRRAWLTQARWAHWCATRSAGRCHARGKDFA
jgi:hypothetical protein